MDDENLDLNKVNDGSSDTKSSSDKNDSDDKGDGGEPTVPISRLREEIGKRKELEFKLQSKDKASSDADKGKEPELKKTVKDVLAEITSETKEREKLDEEQLQKELKDTHDIYGDFDNDKLLKIVEDYGVSDSDGNVKWDKAMELYKKLGGEVKLKPKAPVGNRTGNDGIQETFKTEGKSMWQILEEAKKEMQ